MLSNLILYSILAVLSTGGVVLIIGSVVLVFRSEIGNAMPAVVLALGLLGASYMIAQHLGL